MTTTIETPSVIRRLWKSVLSLGVLTVILGAAVLVWPGQSIVAAGILFVVYLLASGIAQVIAAFTVNSPAASRVLLFISGALSIALGVFALRDYDDGAAVWLLACGSESGSCSKVSARPHWRSASRNCPNVAGTSSWES